MNRFAQPLYGKIIYIYETHLAMADLSTIFSPATYWIDVTGLECEVGYMLEFVDGIGLVFKPPISKEITFGEQKLKKLEQIQSWTGAAIIGGFVSDCAGLTARFDSDIDTQITMQGIALNVNTEQFAAEYPQGCPVRGYAAESDVKTIFMLSADQVLQFCADLSKHIGRQKQRGWELQQAVEAAQSADELNSIVW